MCVCVCVCVRFKDALPIAWLLLTGFYLLKVSHLSKTRATNWGMFKHKSLRIILYLNCNNTYYPPPLLLNSSGPSLQKPHAVLLETCKAESAYLPRLSLFFPPHGSETCYYTAPDFPQLAMSSIPESQYSPFQHWLWTQANNPFQLKKTNNKNMRKILHSRMLQRSPKFCFQLSWSQLDSGLSPNSSQYQFVLVRVSIPAQSS